MTNVAETAVVDHGSHNIDIPITGHFQKSGSAEVGQTQIAERSWDPAEEQGARWQRMVEQGVEGPATQEEEGQNSLKQGQLWQKENEADWEREQQ